MLPHYRLTTESRIDLSQKNRSEQMAQARNSRGDLQRKYREIKGSRPQRIRIQKEMLITEGMKITQNRIAAKLQMAIEEEKLLKQLVVKWLICKGKTIEDIASTLSISKSTVARYARAKKTKKGSLLALVDPPVEAVPKWIRGKSVPRQ